MLEHPSFLNIIVTQFYKCQSLVNKFSLLSKTFIFRNTIKTEAAFLVDIYFVWEYIMNVLMDNSAQINKQLKEASHMIFQAEVIITPREGVLDTQGKAVEKTLTNLGYDGLDEVRVGRIVRMNLEASDADTARKSVESMCQDLLANDLIETYKISLKESCI
jgi:phosphoribosylformylglycinamidine synthase PurS subunit